MRILLARPWLLVVTLFVLFAGRPASAQNADALFERLQSTYESIDALRAKFSQTMTSPYSDMEESFSGTLVFQRDSYRVETGTQTFVTDGTITWIHLPSENQVLINDYIEDETAFSLNNFFLNYSDRYDIAQADVVRIDGAKHYKMELTPKNGDAFFTSVSIWMRDSDNLVTRMEVTDVNETKMTFDLREIEKNPALKAGTFTFTAPAGAEVIDLRS